METNKSEDMQHSERARALATFQTIVRDHYRERGRDLPWRRTRDPYCILVSEFMLQQTQVSRVVPKYDAFCALFPSVGCLATARTGQVLAAWQGLGYNRRALNLRRSAEVIEAEHGGLVPQDMSDLLRLPGVGPATAAAISAFAFGIPIPFLETNIRAVFIHHFFQECSRVPDSDLLPLVEATLDRENPRDWYYALMDYGSVLKRTYENPARKSARASRQTPFAGSHRELRALLLRLFLTPEQNATGGPHVGRALPVEALCASLPARDPREVAVALEELAQEGFLRIDGDGYVVA